VFEYACCEPDDDFSGVGMFASLFIYFFRELFYGGEERKGIFGGEIGGKGERGNSFEEKEKRVLMRMCVNREAPRVITTSSVITDLETKKKTKTG